MTLFNYYLRRSRVYGFLALAGLFLFQYLMAFVYRGFIRNVEGAPAFIMRFIPKGIQVFLGMDRMPVDSISGFLGLVYQHPFVMVVVCALSIICSVEFLAGQVERLTLTHILARPVRRCALPLITFGVCLFWLGLAVAAAFVGTQLGFRRLGFTLPSLPHMLKLTGMLFLLGTAVAGLSLFFASVTNTRSDAAGWSVSVLLLMYVGNYVAQLWDAAKPWATASVFNHYVPMRIFSDGTVPVTNILILAAVALAGVLASLIAYAAREFRL